MVIHLPPVTCHLSLPTCHFATRNMSSSCLTCRASPVPSPGKKTLDWWVPGTQCDAVSSPSGPFPSGPFLQALFFNIFSPFWAS